MPRKISNMEPAPESKRFVKCLKNTVAERGESFGAASLSIGAAYSALAQYGSGRFDRPTPEILAGIVKHWPIEQTVPLLISHLEDEICRGTLSPEHFTLAYHVNAARNETDIDMIQRAAAASPGWAELLSALATMARADSRKGYSIGADMKAEMGKVAEAEAPVYSVRKKEKRGHKK